MNWTIDKVRGPAMFKVKLYGDFDVVEFRQMVDEVCAAKRSHPFRPVLFDDRDFNVKEVIADDLMTVSNMFLFHNAVFAFSKIAILMKDADDLALASRWRQITQPGLIADINVFCQENDALTWLRSPGTAR